MQIFWLNDIASDWCLTFQLHLPFLLFSQFGFLLCSERLLFRKLDLLRFGPKNFLLELSTLRLDSSFLVDLLRLILDHLQNLGNLMRDQINVVQFLLDCLQGVRTGMGIVNEVDEGARLEFEGFVLLLYNIMQL